MTSSAIQGDMEEQRSTQAQPPTLAAQAAFLELQAAELRREAERLSQEACRLRAAAQRRAGIARLDVGQGASRAAVPGSARRPKRIPPALTRRQHEILLLIVRGHTNRQIAEQLVLTSGTVANHVAQMLGRLGLENRVQLAAWAVQNQQHALNESLGEHPARTLD